MYVMAPDPMLNVSFIDLPRRSVYPFMNPSLLRNGSVNIVTAASNTDANMKEHLEPSFSVQSVSYQRKGDDQFSTEFLVQYIRGHSSASTSYRHPEIRQDYAKEENALSLMTSLSLSLSQYTQNTEIYLLGSAFNSSVRIRWGSNWMGHISLWPMLMMWIFGEDKIT
jgi:hypothetical protein